MHTYTGTVQRGVKRASGLGFPTINIALTDRQLSGIYAARVSLGKEIFKAAAFADPTRNILEAYLIDFSPRELYGEEASIELVKKIRESEMFKDDETLRKAIARDVEKVRSMI